MAYIDKIYGSTEQYDIFYAWMQERKPEWLRYFYPRNPENFTNPDDRPITNFPERVDFYLWNNCPIEFVQARLHEQYITEPPKDEPLGERLSYQPATPGMSDWVNVDISTEDGSTYASYRYDELVNHIFKLRREIQKAPPYERKPYRNVISRYQRYLDFLKERRLRS